MFSGIIEEVGKISSIIDSNAGRTFKISAKTILSDIKLGDSIAVSGCCLTVTSFEHNFFTTDATHETLRRTKLGSLKQGSAVNLERALQVSDRLGGHIVSGHIDGLAKVSSIREEGFSWLIEFICDQELAPYFVEKGSVTIDGISLTVAKLGVLDKKSFLFSIAAIPHTLSVTTLKDIKIGDLVNIETDILGKYVARLMSFGSNIFEPNSKQNNKKSSFINSNTNTNTNTTLTKTFLSQHGFI